MTEPETNVRRVYQTYLYATCFVTVVIALFAAATAINALLRIIAPSLSGAGEGAHGFVRKTATGSLVSSLVFGGVAFAVFLYHWSLAKGVRAELDRAASPSLPSIAAPHSPAAAASPMTSASSGAPTEELVEEPAAVRPSRPRTTPSRPRTRKPPASS